MTSQRLLIVLSVLALGVSVGDALRVSVAPSKQDRASTVTLRRAATWKGIFNGSLARAYENFAVESSLVGNHLGKIQSTLWVDLFSRTTSNDLVYRGGQLAMRDSTWPLSNRQYATHLDTTITKITRASRELATRGITLLIFVIPDLTRMEAQSFFGSPNVPAAKDRYLDRLIASLSNNGVRIESLETTLREMKDAGHQPYFVGDHHWTPRAADRAARIEAQRLLELGLIDRADLDPPIQWEGRSGAKSFLRKMRLARFSPLHERIRAKVDYPRLPARPSSHMCAGAHLGSSYSKFLSPELLEHRLNCQAEVLIGSGRGSGWALNQIVSHRTEGPPLRWAVWEVPEYHFYSNLPDKEPLAVAPLFRQGDDIREEN